MLDERTSGLLLHPTSLPTPYPIGDLGPAAHAFVDFLVDSGQRWWQMLPVGPAGKDNSPYYSISAFAGNPLLISPDRLLDMGLLNREDIRHPRLPRVDRVDYVAADRQKTKWLRIAFRNFEASKDSKSHAALDDFYKAESAWLDDFVLFSAISERAGTENWGRWHPELRSRQPAALTRARQELSKELRFHAFVQWLFALQWQTLRAYGRRKGIHFFGDIPIFISLHSADVWANPDIFKLGPDGHPTVVAGVPPDYFSKTGQLWGNPIYRWNVLQKQDYAWWIERIRMARKRFDVLRLDHFIGFVRTYEIPAGAPTAEYGQYVPGPGAPFFKAIEKELGVIPFIAEDLGAVTPEVKSLRDQLGLPGMFVLQFEFDPKMEAKSSIQPGRFPPNSVIYTGTHDNDTSTGWYRKLSMRQQKVIAKALAVPVKEIHWGMIQVALKARSRAAIIPFQDLLGLGSQARMNLPGTAKGNWRWRLSPGKLTPELAQRLRQLTKISKR